LNPRDLMKLKLPRGLTFLTFAFMTRGLPSMTD